LTGLKEKVKFLESKLGACDQELRKMLEEKRNYEELIRMEKDKLMNMELEFKRERR
jgi:phosphatidate phosphatase PAH1